MRFVSTPEILERVVSIETELQQIESSVQANDPSNADLEGMICNDCPFKALVVYLFLQLIKFYCFVSGATGNMQRSSASLKVKSCRT